MSGTGGRGPEPPPPRDGFVDEVMKRVALRPAPRPSRWARLRAIRPVLVGSVGGLLAGAAALALTLRAPDPAGPTRPAPTVATPAGTPVAVRFTLHAPDARSVELAGEFNGWRNTQLARAADGTWEAELALPPGRFSYSFVVDGRWVGDPAASEERDDGFGGRNAVVRVTPHS